LVLQKTMKNGKTILKKRVKQRDIIDNMSKINFNGKEYNSLNEIPDEYKVMFKDENNNGIPDFVEGLLNANATGSQKPITANFSSFFYNGKQYSSIDQMPSGVKEMVKNGLSKLENSGFNVMAPNLSQNSAAQNGSIKNNSINISHTTMPQELKDEAQQELRPGFKFRLIMTGVMLVLAVVYIIWLLKII